MCLISDPMVESADLPHKQRPSHSSQHIAGAEELVTGEGSVLSDVHDVLCHADHPRCCTVPLALHKCMEILNLHSSTRHAVH
jgi:hypothetical protein